MGSIGNELLYKSHCSTYKQLTDSDGSLSVLACPIFVLRSNVEEKVEISVGSCWGSCNILGSRLSHVNRRPFLANGPLQPKCCLVIFLFQYMYRAFFNYLVK